MGVGVAVVIECTEFEREGSLEFGQAGVGCSEFADEAKFAAGDAGSGDAEVPCRSAWLGDGRRSGSELERPPPGRVRGGLGLGGRGRMMEG